MNTIDVLIEGLNLACGITRVVNAAIDASKHPETNVYLRTANVGAKALGLVLQGCEVNAVVHGATSEDLLALKEIELAEKIFIEAPIRIGTGLANREARNIEKSLGTEFIPAFAEIFRAGSEVAECEAKITLNHVPTNLDTNPYHYVRKVGSANVSDGVLRNEKEYKDFFNSQVEITRDFDITASGASLALESRIANRLLCNNNRNLIPPQQLAPILIVQQQEAPPVVIDQNSFEDGSDLLTLSFIPSILYEGDPDSIFLKYRCPILDKPARFPVKDPTTTGNACVVYEKAAILNSLRTNRLSPVTRQPLAARDLIPMRAGQELIEAKLRECQPAWDNFLNSHPELRGSLHAPNARELVEAAALEMGPGFQG